MLITKRRMLQESTWKGIRILNDVDVYDRQAVKREIESLNWSEGVTHSQVVSAATKHCGAWANSIPFNEYSDWTESLDFDDRKKTRDELKADISAVSLTILEL
jgi:hypothetical protein